MDSRSVSVIIPAFRAARTIRRALDSVLSQKVPAAEIIVVDDGSPDDQAAVVAEYGDRVVLVRKRNAGVAAARNDGIERAMGDLIAFLDADDYWEPDKLERHVELYRRYPGLGLTSSAYYSEQPGENSRCLVKAVNVPEDRVFRSVPQEAFGMAVDISTITVLVPRSIVGHERFESVLETGEDRDMWVRLLLKAPAYYISRPLATAVLEPGSLSRTNIDRQHSLRLRVIRSYASILGTAGVRFWETDTYRRWAAHHLGDSCAAAAVRPALHRLLRQPLSGQAWWIAFKSVVLACRDRLRRRKMSRGLRIPTSIR
jgi:glycosyltransferase involved in cell wall biosynthesis